MSTLLEAVRVSKTYTTNIKTVRVLHEICLKVCQKEALCIMGASGAGKSTLLHILGTLDKPTSGEILYNGENVYDFSSEKLATFRNKTVGFVFQAYHLLKEFTALENVMLPAQIANESNIKDRAMELLETLGLSHRKQHLPKELSGGEQQRIAIARALMQNPDILFCDEPTGNLDSRNEEIIKNMLLELNRKTGITLVVVTHDLSFSKMFPRVLNMKDGKWLV